MVVAPGRLQQSTNHYADHVWFKYLLSCLAATTAECATYPLDLAKTRLQIQGERGVNGNANANINVSVNGSHAHATIAKAGGPEYRGLVGTAVGIVREEGPLKLWQGITPAVYRHLVYTGTRMVLYEKVRDTLFTFRPDGSRPVWQPIMGGILVGGIAQFLASPADLVKVQMQMEGKRILEGKPPRVKCASEAFIRIYGAGGIRGLWKGCMPNVYRSALVNLGDLTTYDSVKRFFVLEWGLKDTYYTHALASACSGLVAATLGTPADVVKARVMNQPTDSNGRAMLYKNSLDCLLKTAHNEGIFALYKGFIPCWLRMGPWSLTFWITYEQIRSLAGSQPF